MDLLARIFRVVRAHTVAAEPSGAYSHLNKEIEKNVSNLHGADTERGFGDDFNRNTRCHSQLSQAPSRYLIFKRIHYLLSRIKRKGI